MNRSTLALILAGLCSCASTHSDSSFDAAPLQPSGLRRTVTREHAPGFELRAPAEAARSTPAAESIYTAAELAVDPAAATASVQSGGGPATTYFTLKAGLYTADTDLADLDEEDGPIFNVAFGRYLGDSQNVAFEIEIGYLSTEDDLPGVDLEVYGIPVMLNGRVGTSGPIQLYGGAGIGAIYYDAEVSIPLLGSADDDGFIFAGNAFAGAGLKLGDTVMMGLEGKYYVTEDIDDVDESLEGLAIMLTLGVIP